MKAAQFNYVRAASLSDALQRLAQFEGQAKVVAGSQSLGPMLNLRLARPAELIDVSGLSEMRGVAIIGQTIRVGASITHAEIEDGLFDALRGHPVQEVAARIAYRSVRNRGTLAGSLAHADPAADWVLAATALEAQLEIAALNQEPRLVPMSEFMLAAYTTVLQPTELITAVHFPCVDAQARWGYYKFCRKTGEFAEANCAAYFDPASQSARIVVGALDGAPVTLAHLAAEVAQVGLAAASDAQIDSAVTSALGRLDELSRRMICAAVKRCLLQAHGKRVPT